MDNSPSVTITQQDKYRFLVVTESVRRGIPVALTVEDGQGVRLKEPATLIS